MSAPPGLDPDEPDPALHSWDPKTHAWDRPPSPPSDPPLDNRPPPFAQRYDALLWLVTFSSLTLTVVAYTVASRQGFCSQMGKILWLCGVAWWIAMFGTTVFATIYPRVGPRRRFTTAAKLSMTLNILVGVFALGGCLDGAAWSMTSCF